MRILQKIGLKAILSRIQPKTPPRSTQNPPRTKTGQNRLYLPQMISMAEKTAKGAVAKKSAPAKKTPPTKKGELPHRYDPSVWEKLQKIGTAAFRKLERSGGKDYKTFAGPADLWALAVEYFADSEANPAMRQEVLKGGRAAGTVAFVETPRPLSWSGFEVFLIGQGIVHGLDHIRRNVSGNWTAYIPVVNAIERVMNAQKFEGASVGIFNPSIIARDLESYTQRKLLLETKLGVTKKIDYDKLSTETLEEIAQAAKQPDDGHETRED